MQATLTPRASLAPSTSASQYLMGCTRVVGRIAPQIMLVMMPAIAA
jgi:hypothetical protein